MRCMICGNEITNYGNNPYPLCQRDDYDSRCCDDCDQFVIQARLMTMRGKVNEYLDKDGDITIKEGDLIAIFYSTNSELPTIQIKENGKFLAGYVEEVDLEYRQLSGSWGNFTVDLEKDTYMKIEE